MYYAKQTCFAKNVTLLIFLIKKKKHFLELNNKCINLHFNHTKKKILKLTTRVFFI